MKKTHIAIFIASVLTLFSTTAAISSCSFKSNEDTKNNYISLYYTLMKEGLYDSLYSVAGKTFSNRSNDHDQWLTLYSGLQCAQAALFMDDYPKAAAYMDTVSSLRYRDKYPDLSAVFNIVTAIYDIKNGFNYSSALIHLMEALNYYRGSSDVTNTCITLCNISDIYFFRKDTTGIRYAREAEEISNRYPDNPYMKCVAYTEMATMLYLKNDWSNAEQYALRAEKIASARNYSAMMPRICMILAETAMNSGNIDMAEELLDKGFRTTDNIISDNYFELALSYGKLLRLKRQEDDAEEFLKNVLKTAAGSNNIRYCWQIEQLLSNLYETRGDLPEAYSWLKSSIASMNNLVNIDKEKAFNNLLNMYDKASLQNALKKKRLGIYLVTFICILSIIIGSFILYQYFHQKRLNKELVLRNQEYERKTRMLHRYFNSRQSKDNKSIDESLFHKLEKLMREKHIYRLNDVSLDKLASILGTNRTYVSRIINTFAGKTFWDYINMYRIAEATQILSDPDNDIQIKNLYEILGYNSPASFFKVFRKEVGITPSKYREEIHRIKTRQ